MWESFRQTRGVNEREEDNKAKQWGHQNWEMDGRGERQSWERGGDGEKRKEGFSDRKGERMKLGRRRHEENVGLRALKKWK